MHPHVLEQIQSAREFHKLINLRNPRRRLRRPLPRQQQPDHIRLGYYGELRRRVLLPAKALVDRHLVPLLRGLVEEHERATKLDAGPGDVNEVVKGITVDFDEHLDAEGIQGLAFKYAKATTQYQKDQLGRQLQAAVGVQVPMSDRKIGPLIAHFTAENVALIKSIPQRYFTQVETTVLRGIGEGKRWEAVAEDLDDRFEVSESTARLIARDQVGKFYGSLNEARQTDLGIERFTWRTVHDNRVRELHQEYDGESYEWSDPPEDGIPGEPVNCRCTADPDLSSIIDNLDL